MKPQTASSVQQGEVWHRGLQGEPYRRSLKISSQYYRLLFDGNLRGGR